MAGEQYCCWRGSILMKKLVLIVALSAAVGVGTYTALTAVGSLTTTAQAKEE
jgi:hypothetical protein